MNDPEERQRGAVLPLMAIMLVILMGLAAMAIDLGWLFWQSVEIQHGADAAALAGVVYEPDHPADAHVEAVAAAKENGYDNASVETSVAVVDFFDDETAVVNESMLRVTVTHAVPTFFLKLFGFDTLNVSRTAVAEFVQPLALGSPEDYFGNDPALGRNPGFWGDSTSNYVAKEGGNRFGALCLADGFGAACRGEKTGGVNRGLNPEGRVPSGWGTPSAQGGYLFGIEVEPGSSAGLNVEIFNGPLYEIRKWAPASAAPLDDWGEPNTGNFAGDSKYRPEDRNVRQTTWFMLYGPDPTPTDTTDGNELLCSIAYKERLPSEEPDVTNPPNSSAYLADFGDMGWDTSWLEFDQVPPNILNAMWDSMHAGAYADSQTGNCAGSFDRGPGVYVLRVLDEYDNTGATNITQSWRGSNRFSLRVSSSGPQSPAVYAIEDMVMGAARDTHATEFFLARVNQKYAGKNLILELWDVGDIFGGLGSDNFSILDGTRSVVTCTWKATDTSPLPPPHSHPNPTSGGPGPCTINASGKQFNDELITITVEIPESYTCTGTGCWWKIRYNYAGQVKDTTTWTAYIDANPIRIVE